MKFKKGDIVEWNYDLGTFGIVTKVLKRENRIIVWGFNEKLYYTEYVEDMILITSIFRSYFKGRKCANFNERI